MHRVVNGSLIKIYESGCYPYTQNRIQLIDSNNISKGIKV